MCTVWLQHWEASYWRWSIETDVISYTALSNLFAVFCSSHILVSHWVCGCHSRIRLEALRVLFFFFLTRLFVLRYFWCWGAFTSLWGMLIFTQSPPPGHLYNACIIMYLWSEPRNHLWVVCPTASSKQNLILFCPLSPHTKYASEKQTLGPAHIAVIGSGTDTWPSLAQWQSGRVWWKVLGKCFLAPLGRIQKPFIIAVLLAEAASPLTAQGELTYRTGESWEKHRTVEPGLGQGSPDAVLLLPSVPRVSVALPAFQPVWVEFSVTCG